MWQVEETKPEEVLPAAEQPSEADIHGVWPLRKVKLLIVCVELLWIWIAVANPSLFQVAVNTSVEVAGDAETTGVEVAGDAETTGVEVAEDAENAPWPWPHSFHKTETSGDEQDFFVIGCIQVMSIGFQWLKLKFI